MGLEAVEALPSVGRGSDGAMERSNLSSRYFPVLGAIATPRADGIAQSKCEDGGGQRKTKPCLLGHPLRSPGAEHPLSVSLQAARRSQPTWRASEAKTPGLSCTYPGPLPPLPLPLPSILLGRGYGLGSFRSR